MGVTVDEYIPFQARVNPGGTVDVLANGSPVPGGAGLPMAEATELLAAYAARHGNLLMTTTHPDGSVTRDLIAPTGEVTPFYPPEQRVTRQEVRDRNHAQLLNSLDRAGLRKVTASEAAAAPVQPVAPATVRVQLGEGSIPKVNVEADVAKALAAKKPPRPSAKTMAVAVAVTVAALAGLATLGWKFLSVGMVVLL